MPIAVNTGSEKAKNNLSLVSKAQLLVFQTALDALYLGLSVYSLALLIFHRLQILWLKIGQNNNPKPQLINKDISSLPKIPRHVASLLNLKENQKGGGLDTLLEQVGELASWCSGAGIPALTIYERQGVLKALDPKEFQRRISKKLDHYYGDTPSPSIRVKIPPLTSNDAPPTEEAALTITLIAEEDGRQSLVDLTRTLGDLALQKKISPKDITIASIDAELKHITVDEPDLLIVFGPELDLQGFPPWQMRLSEIFHLPDNNEVSYPVFLKGLEKYAGCKINVGR